MGKDIKQVEASGTQSKQTTTFTKEGHVDQHGVYREESHLRQEKNASRIDNPTDTKAVREEAIRMKEQLPLEQQRSERFANQSEEVREAAGTIEKELKSVESAADKNAAELAKLQREHIKDESKEKQKLDKQEAKVMKMAQELAEKQAISMENERIKEEKLRQAEAEAERLARQKLQLLAQQRQAAQMRAEELFRKQEEARKKFAEMSNLKEQDKNAFKLQIDQLHEGEMAARRNTELLEKRMKEAEQELADSRKELDELKNRARTAAEAAQAKRAELEQLERRMQELAMEEADSRERAQQLQGAIANQQQELQQKRQQVEQTRAETKDTELALRQREEQRVSIQRVSKETLATEEEAKRRAKELADRHARDLERANEEIRKLQEEEQRIAEKEGRLAANADRSRTVETGEQITDVYTHTKVKTENATRIETEPHVTADGTEVTGKESKGVFSKIGDTISKIL